MLITEPNGVPSITCPGCDIWLLMENHISMSTPRKNIYMSFFLVYRTSLWYTCPFLFSFFVSLLSWWQGEWGKNVPLLFVFQRAYRVLCKKCSKSERWDKNDQWKTNKCPIQCLWVIFYVKSCFWEEEMWVKRRSIFEVFEGKPFFWIWRMNVTRRWWEKRILVLKKRLRFLKSWDHTKGKNILFLIWKTVYLTNSDWCISWLLVLKKCTRWKTES